MRDELPSGLVLPPGVRAEDCAVVERRPAPRLSPRVAALRADLKVAGPALLAFYNTTKGRW
jgi:hypothetical protein